MQLDFLCYFQFYKSKSTLSCDVRKVVLINRKCVEPRTNKYVSNFAESTNLQLFRSTILSNVRMSFKRRMKHYRKSIDQCQNTIFYINNEKGNTMRKIYKMGAFFQTASVDATL